MNRANRTIVHNEPAPDRNDEYRFYQALLGTWPADLIQPAAPPERAPAALVDRLRDYMTKAIREAKTHTSWISQDRAYDEAVARFVNRALAGPTSRLFLAAFVPFLARIAPLGMVNSLAQLVLKIACPGVADFYQGSELWNLTLVDPDNRGPVDVELRCRRLDELTPLLEAIERAHGPEENCAAPAALTDEVGRLVADWPDGRIKLLVTACGLRFRRAHPDLFLRGAYLPLVSSPPILAQAQGGPDERRAMTAAGDVIACARRHARDAFVAIVPRHVAHVPRPVRGLPLGPESWTTARVLLPPDLPAGPYRNLVTGESVRVMRHKNEAWVFVGEALAVCPVALLYAHDQ